ncbi:hypothetical protein G8764_17260 [Pseudomaricurvus alcaniphilus]|uniref:hypothetical protein n=1 Tax=Pseudomaricurvus alcaniphilus TaxID=1166482 RepID=UPI00140ADBCF|nr:hypothetical protein [Pseudomaricurvus alcaniphilus]NHN39056.1 hypothetical protein [Pseudomaricurvus alcaniphilus]
MAATAATPADLSAWESWVAKDHPELGCPWLADQTNARQCAWPGRMHLQLQPRGLSFALDIEVFGQSATVALPGDQQHWPRAVQVNGKPAALLEQKGIPHVVLGPGSHLVSGSFSWAKLPGQLSVPTSIALVTLTRDGQPQSVDRRQDQIVFASKSDARVAQSRDSLGIEVYRKLSDGIPLLLETRIKLQVSGKPREVSFGKVLLANSEVMELQSPVPARVEANGDMRAQVGAGEHVIQLLTRFTVNPEALQLLQPASADWPQAEYISVAAAPELRQLKLGGAVSVDTSQIGLPPQWVELPTYRLDKDTRLTLTTEYRGDHAPAANELNLQRDLWLDFDGRGLTTLEQIKGRMQRDWRLNAAADTRVGRATVDGEPVLITLDDAQQGIEVRSPNINLEAVSRLETRSGFSAIGWQARAESYAATLHLPPGWRVLHAAGVDEIAGTWLSQWDLWDVFLILVIVAATRKLLSNRAAALAGLTFLLALQEPNAPLLVIPVLLIIIALLPLTSSWIKSSLTSLGVMLGAGFVLLFIGFAVDSFRLAIYPSLERAAVGEYYPSRSRSAGNYAVTSAPQMALEEAADARLGPLKSKQRQMQEAPPQRDLELYEVADDDRVQTGPGLPTWTWDAVYLRASGPVRADQQLALYYSPPWLTSCWRVLAVLLVGGYAGLVLRRLAQLIERRRGTAAAGGSMATLGAGLLLLVMWLPQPGLAAEYPPQYLLKQLEQRLTRAPECLPACVSLNNGKVIVRASVMQIAFDVYAEANLALALPGGGSSWQLQQVLADGKRVPLGAGPGGVLVQLPRGQHSIEMLAALSGDQVAINFPLPLHNVEVVAPDWRVEGLVNGRILNSTLNFRSVDKDRVQVSDTLQPDPVADFVVVRRSFQFAQQWRVNTRVERQAPAAGAISIAIPLLANEQLLTDVGVVKDGKISVQLGHHQRAVSWSSILAPVDQLALTAATESHYVEEWQFVPSSRWRLGYRGIPPLQSRDGGSALRPTFKPWPGEQLLVDISRPEGVSGPTHTVEKAALQVNAGKQLQKSSLSLEIRSSLGEDYALLLPESAEVLGLSLNGRAMNLPPGNRVVVPLQPGYQQLSLEFQQVIPLGLIDRSPQITLPTGATNLSLNYRLPRDRWPLFISGPAIGPAMLYWGVLCVIVLGAFALAYLSSSLRLAMPITLFGWLLLGIGLSTVNSYGVLVTAVLFFLLAVRRQHIDPQAMSRNRFNLLQVFIVVMGVLTAFSIISAIPMGLLASPEMKVVGNGSDSHWYNYYQDRVSSEDFPGVTVVSVPIIAYRLVMLLWSLWLATKIIQWASWGWHCFSAQGTWRAKVDSAAESKTGGGAGPETGPPS